jgi:hypothetical protein
MADLWKQITAIEPGSDAAIELRNAAVTGDQEKLKRYVYWSVWRAIKGDAFIPREKKVPLFRALINADAIEVSLGESKT